MGTHEYGQVTSSAADIYDTFFVPALFAEWAPRVIQAAKIKRGDRVLDVASGTGVLARAAQKQVGPDGAVTGLDINKGMLNVARVKSQGIEWKQSRAEAIPFEDASFDAVVSQFGLMFFEDQPAAVREMMRVLAPGRNLVIAVWGPLQQTPGYAALADLLRRLFGEQAAASLYAPFSLGDLQRLRSIFTQAGYPQADIETKIGTARFPSLQSWMFTEIKGWTLADQLTDAQYELLLKEVEPAFRKFVQPDGTVAFDTPAHIVTVQK